MDSDVKLNGFMDSVLLPPRRLTLQSQAHHSEADVGCNRVFVLLLSGLNEAPWTS